MKIFLTSATAAMAFLAFSAFAREHTALNGTWTLVPEKSDFAGQPVMQSGTVTINEREGNITVSRSFSYQGATGTVFYSDSIDGENNTTIHSGTDVRSKARWDHDVLRVTSTQAGATTVENYSLAPDGTMTVRVEKPKQREFTLVYVRR
jgi:hypothetical protein